MPAKTKTVSVEAWGIFASSRSKLPYDVRSNPKDLQWIERNFPGEKLRRVTVTYELKKPKRKT